MDENKLKKLYDVGYVVKKCCGFCKHYNAGVPFHNLFSTCKIHTYEHRKHNDSTRQLSVTCFGACFDFEPNEHLIDRLYKFADFMEE